MAATWDTEMEELPLPRTKAHPVSGGAKTIEHFYAYLPTHQYLCIATRELWPASSVDATVTMPPHTKGKPSAYLDQTRHVEQMTWAPSLPRIITDKVVSGGGWIDRLGYSCFNLYQPPELTHGEPDTAGPWLELVHRVFTHDAQHLIRWLAHRVQRPGEKINHALVLGGAQGIGKDSIIEPVMHAVGPWNCHEVSPTQLMGRFNGFVKSVILRVSEARDQRDGGGGKIDRYAVYEHCKTLLAAPPTVLRCDEKSIREYGVMNVCGVVFTTNHRDGLYLPPDDRRHFVAWSELRQEDFPANYWVDLYYWYEHEGGYGHVAAYLASLDISGFDPKAPPPKTPAFYRMVDAGRAPEDAELADLVDVMSKDGKPPAAITIGDLLAVCVEESFRDWLKDRRNSRQIPHRMEAAGYVAVRNDADKHDGQWRVGGKRQVIYARRELSLRDRHAAAEDRCRRDR